MSKTTITVIAAALLGAFYLMAPPATTSKLTMPINRLLGEAGQLCFDLHRTSLVDPTSAYLIKTTQTPERVFITLRARNGLNMEITGSFECPLLNGQFDEHTAFIEKINRNAQP